MHIKYIFLGFLMVWAATLAAQNQDSRVFSPADVLAGEKLFRMHCVNCHGRFGQGGTGPDLTRDQFRYANSDAGLYQLLDKGIPKSGMPRLVRSETALWQVVAYIRAISSKSAKTPVTGDVTKGAGLFHEKLECKTCHMINGKGGRQGPDLSTVGRLRSSEHLRTSIAKPSDDVPMRWWSMRITIREGDIIEGFRYDEDTFSIRILDRHDNLRSFLKNEIAGYERIKTSTMPSYTDLISEPEFNDLVAYLFSLGRE